MILQHPALKNYNDVCMDVTNTETTTMNNTMTLEVGSFHDTQKPIIITRVFESHDQQ